MKKTYNEYMTMALNGAAMEEVVSLARTDYGVVTDLSVVPEVLYSEDEIPFNLERKYVDELVDKGEYTKALSVLVRMKHSYKDVTWQNLIEGYEYHVKAIMKSNHIMRESMLEAKKEFNQHAITLLTIIVGIITIFGTANEVFHLHTYREMFITFMTMLFAIIAIILTASLINIRFPKK